MTNVKKSKKSRELTQTMFSASSKKLIRRLRPVNSDRKKRHAKSKGKKSVSRKIVVESRKKNRLRKLNRWLKTRNPMRLMISNNTN